MSIKGNISLYYHHFNSFWFLPFWFTDKLIFLCWYSVIIYSTISDSNCTIFSFNKFERLEIFLDLGRGSSLRVMVGPEAGPVENHWFKQCSNADEQTVLSLRVQLRGNQPARSQTWTQTTVLRRRRGEDDDQDIYTNLWVNLLPFNTFFHYLQIFFNTTTTSSCTKYQSERFYDIYIDFIIQHLLAFSHILKNVSPHAKIRGDSPALLSACQLCRRPF